jgi:hypothetical protein
LTARAAGPGPDPGLGLDPERSTLYCDLVLNSMPEAARRALQAMNPSKYEYQSEFARRYVAQSRVEMVLKLLTTRYGELSAAVAERVQGANTADLVAIAERMLTAQTLDEALGTR